MSLFTHGTPEELLLCSRRHGGSVHYHLRANEASEVAVVVLFFSGTARSAESHWF